MTFEERCNYIFNKYRTEFDTINEVYDIADYLNGLYEQGGISAVNDWFLPSATNQYKKDFKSLITKITDKDLNNNLTESATKRRINRKINEFEDTEKEYAQFLRSKDSKDLSDYDKNVLAKDDLITKYMEDPSDDDFLDKLLDLNRKTNSINSDNECNYQDFLNNKQKELTKELTVYDEGEHPDSQRVEDLAYRMIKFEYDHDPYEYKDIYNSDEEAYNEELKVLFDDEARAKAVEWYKEILEEDNPEVDKAEAQAIIDEINSLFGNEINESELKEAEDVISVDSKTISLVTAISLDSDRLQKELNYLKPNLDHIKYWANEIEAESTELYGLFQQSLSNLNESYEGNQDFWSNFNYKVGDTFNTEMGEAVLLDHNSTGNYILIKLPTEYVAAWNPEFSDDKLVWGQGHYFDDETSAREFFDSKFYN